MDLENESGILFLQTNYFFSRRKPIPKHFSGKIPCRLTIFLVPIKAEYSANYPYYEVWLHICKGTQKLDVLFEKTKKQTPIYKAMIMINKGSPSSSSLVVSNYTVLYFMCNIFFISYTYLVFKKE